MTATDLGRPVFEARREAVAYIQADLTDAGDAYAAVRGHDAVVHAAAIPDPDEQPAAPRLPEQPDGVFNTLEAAMRFGSARFVNISSETVPGFFFPERQWLPDYVPVDEEHPIRPQDPYATAKHFGEQLMDGAVRPSDIGCMSIRPSWVQWEGNYEQDIGPWLREPAVSQGFWAYIDVYDLADAIGLAAEAATPGHEVFYIAVARHRGARAARATRAPLLRGRRARDPAIGRAAPRRDLDRQGTAAARLRPAALVARLPRRRRPPARGGRASAWNAARPASSAAFGSPGMA